MSEEHSDDVYAIQMVGCILVSGSTGKTVRIWDLLAQRLIAPPLLGHNGGVLSLHFNPNPRRDIIFSGDTNGQVICWKFSTRAMIGQLADAHDDPVMAMNVDDDRLISGSAYGIVKLWQLDHGYRDALQTTEDRAQTIFHWARWRCQCCDISGDLLVSAQSVQRSSTCNLLGFTGSFPGPHVDYLKGTWIRCISGVKAWIIAVGLTAEDYIEFATQGNFWCPEDKTRIVILEAGDVLWMPPGLLVVHSPITIDNCLMYGGMMWDTNREATIAANIRWIAMHANVTNEDLPSGLIEQMRSMGAHRSAN
ncbi:hypothetical protein LTR86_011106 [Recurvomyces mirabilis]|nr:hypothetical protein LTR86_011106 [Recurvomyces mirabilis]